MYDLIVIGGGPAGLSASIYALRKRLNVLMVTRDLGGMTNFRMDLPWIEEYSTNPGLELVKKFRSELEYLDFARHMEAVEKICKHESGGFTVKTHGGGELSGQAVIVASGAQPISIDAPGVRDFMGRGVGFSAISYASQFIDRLVVVVGDGELALRSTAELALSTKHVTLVREQTGATDSPLEGKLQQAKNVTILNGCHLTGVKGDENFARSVMIKDSEGKVNAIPAEGIFIEKGLTPNSKMVAELVELDKSGRIVVDSHNATNVLGVFAAGDVTNVYAEQVLVAIGDGVKAALSAYDYLLATKCC